MSQTLYRFYAGDARLLYVGITAWLPQRLDAHQRGKPWWEEIAFITVKHYKTREGVAAAELQAIRTEAPFYNVAGKPGFPSRPHVDPEPKIRRQDREPMYEDLIRLMMGPIDSQEDQREVARRRREVDRTLKVFAADPRRVGVQARDIIRLVRRENARPQDDGPLARLLAEADRLTA